MLHFGERDMKKRFGHRRASVIALAVTLIIALSATSVVSISYAASANEGSSASENASAKSAAADLKTVTLESNIIPAEQHDPTLIPLSGKDGGIAPESPHVAEYNINDSRFFYLNITGSTYTSLPGTLKAQGAHTNIWIINDAAYHAAKGTVHSNANCKLTSISTASAAAIAAAFDDIYQRMTNPATGFATHAGVLVRTSWANIPSVGDIGQDNKVNFVLYDIYGDGESSNAYTAGYFWSGNYQTAEYQGGCAPIDMLNVDIGVNQGYDALTSDPLATYSTLSHEFQHMLFYMYYGIYLGNNFDVSWFNESVSELAATYYVQPGAELAGFSRIYAAAANTYAAGGTYSDFFTHKNLKNYGMEKLFAMNVYKITDGHFAPDLYRHFIAQYPPANTTTAFNANRASIISPTSAANMKNGVGKMLKASLGASLPGLLAMSDEAALRSVYSLFMETFASDGGLLAASPPTQTTKLYSATFGSNNLWGFRSAFGTPGNAGRLYYDPTNFLPLSSEPALPTLTSGGTVSVNGYAGTPTAGNVSCEKLYKLTPTDASNPALRITVNDSGDTANATRYYVALENPTSDVLYAGISGAAIIPVTKGTPNIINTDGRRAWLFVSTWFRAVNGASVTYGYKSGQQATPTTPPALDSTTYTAITLEEGAGYEYSMDSVHWQDSGGFTGLLSDTQYRFYQRLKETDSLYASSPSPSLVARTVKRATSATTPPSTTTPDTPNARPKVQKINVSVVFNAYGGKTGGAKTVRMSETYGAKYKLPATPARAGYTFAGWYTAAKGGAKITAATTVSKKTAHTLYARWTARTFTVKFNVNKGKKLFKKLATKTVKFGAKLGKLPTPKRSKYSFRGWYTKKSGGKRYTRYTQMNKAGALTLYAHWKKKR